MNPSPQQLVNSKLKPIYLLSGTEPLLTAETCTTIRQLAQKHGFTERLLLTVDKNFNWQEFISNTNNISLFAANTLLELRLNSKPGTAGSKILQEYASNPPLDKVLIVILPKLETATKSSKWYKALEKAGTAIQLWPISSNQFPGWLKARLAQYKLATTNEGLQILASYTEGNLLAAAQEIEKLQLLYGEGMISTAQLSAAVANSSRFTLFNLVDNILLANKPKALRILSDLRQQKSEPTLVLWAISKELRLIYQMQKQRQNGTPTNTILQNHKIWQSRQPIIQTALKVYNPPILQQMLRHCAKIDRLIKGIDSGAVWNELELLIAPSY